MIDNISVKVENFKEKEWINLIHSLNIKSLVNKKNKQYVSWANLRLEYYPNSKEVWIKNSIHKFYNAIVREKSIGEVNHDDFGRKELIESIEYICLVFKRVESDFEVFGLFEYGVNINVNSYQPRDVYLSYLSYLSTSANYFYSLTPLKGKEIGVHCSLSQYRIKFYDKSIQSELTQKGIFRFEICSYKIGRLKKILNKNKVTFVELLSEETYLKLIYDLLDTYDRIVMSPIGIKVPREVLKELLFSNHKVGIDYDKINLSKWKRDRKRKEQKKSFKEYSNLLTNYHHIVRDKILNKLITILINPFII